MVGLLLGPLDFILPFDSEKASARVSALAFQSVGTLAVLNALMAGSALSGAWCNDGDHLYGRCDRLRLDVLLLAALKNRFGIMGTSG